MANRTCMLVTKLTIDERVALKRLAQKFDMNCSSFVRLVIQGAVKEGTISLLDDEYGLINAGRQLIFLARELNEITKAIHTHTPHIVINEHYLNRIKESAELVKAAVDACNQRIKERRNKLLYE